MLWGGIRDGIILDDWIRGVCGVEVVRGGGMGDGGERGGVG